MIADIRQRLLDILQNTIRPELVTAGAATTRIAQSMPQRINTFDLPAFYVRPLATTRTRDSNFSWAVVTQWELTLIGYEVLTGLSTEIEQTMVEWQDIVYNSWRNLTRLPYNDTGLSGIVVAELIGDSGLQVVQYPITNEQKSYYAITFNLQTTYSQACE